MANTDLRNEEFLAVVSEWSSYGRDSASRVGNAYPFFNLTRGTVVDKPMDDFPNPGYIFLVNRGELVAWDYVRIKPVENARYKHANPRECFYIARGTPSALETPTPDLNGALVLDVPHFDPATSESVIRRPPQGVTPVFYVRNALQRIFGPLRRTQVIRSNYETIDAIGWAPLNNDGVLYEFSPEALKKQNLQVLAYEHPERDLNEVVHHPLTVLAGPVLTATSDKAHDRLSDVQLAEWFLRWAPVNEAQDEGVRKIQETLLSRLRTAMEVADANTPEIYRRRCKRLATLGFNLEVLQDEGRKVVRRYMESAEGKERLDREMKLEIERRAERLDAEVKKKKQELAAEEQKLATQRKALEEEFRRQELALQGDLRKLEHQRTEMDAALATLEDQVQRKSDELAAQVRDHLPILAALTSLRRSPAEGNGHGPVATQPAVREARPSPVTDPLATPPPAAVATKKLTEVTDEAVLVDQLAAELTASHLFFSRDFLANLYVTLKSSALNLITGPPGHGKSSVVAALARALGHGNALLEIAVRRSWSDDRYLLGFYDTFHGRYDPGPTGLATRLLQAQVDWEQGQNGLYVVLMDEFNLAAPEYYFSQLLQLVTRPRDQRVLQLFDPAIVPGGDGRPAPVHQIRLHPNVSFWGTINHDETTERLSPRLLDRTGMIFLTARDLSPSLTAQEAWTHLTPPGVKAQQLFQQFYRTAEQCPDELWEGIAPLLDLLKRPTDDFGTGLDLSPRVLDAIKRYLANSPNVLPKNKAVDFVFQQRVLPCLRGRGPRFAARIKALAEQLAKAGLERSARQVNDALSLAEANFGDVDFLAYA